MSKPSCAGCVRLHQQHYTFTRQSAEAFGNNDVKYVRAMATIKRIEKAMWDHVKVCQD